MTCKKCGREMDWCGVSRKLITRGREKGHSRIIDFYTCVCFSKNQEEEGDCVVQTAEKLHDTV